MVIIQDSNNFKAPKSVAASCAALALTVSLAGCGTVGSSDANASSKDDTRNTIRESLNWRTSKLGETVVTASGAKVSVNTGNAILDVDKGKGLNIAFFNAAMDTTYTQAMAAGVKDMAEELGANVTLFEAGWDGSKQLSQIENALGGGQYNAFLVYAAEGSTVCKALTEDAPAANIMVVPMITPLCGKTLAEGPDLVTPGSLSTIMGGGIVEYYRLWAEYVSSQITEPTKVVYVAGPNAQDVVVAAEEAVRAAASKNPNFELLEVYYADYSGDSALQATQNALVTHPNTQIVLSHFSTITIGILRALNDANRSDVKVFDLGGDETVKQPILDGRVAASVPYFPYTAGTCGVDILNAAFSGDSVPSLVLSECGKGGIDTNKQTNTVIDKNNVNNFDFEY